MFRDLSFKNLQEIKEGDKIIFDGQVGTVVKDDSYTGGVRVGGMSLKYIIENHTDVEFYSV